MAVHELKTSRKSRAAVKADEELFRVADWPMQYLLAIDRHHVRNMARVLRPSGCSPLVWRVLSILSDRDGHSLSELAEVSVIERSNLGRIVDAMERDGLVARYERENDKRQTAVHLAEPGRLVFVESLPAVLRYYSRFLTGLSPTEMTVLMAALKKIKRNVTAFDARDDDASARP